MKVFARTDYEQASEWLDAGNLLAYPTEAVWGIGCDPFNQQAVKKLLALKNRPIEKGIIVITATDGLITDFLQPLPPVVQNNISTTWQTSDNQATTFLLPIPQQIIIPNWITGGHSTLAIRVINHPHVAKLCQTLAEKNPNNPYGFLVSTSCNPSGQPPATTLEQAQAYFGEFPNVGYFDSDTLGYTKPSQIKDAITGELVRF